MLLVGQMSSDFKSYAVQLLIHPPYLDLHFFVKAVIIPRPS